MTTCNGRGSSPGSFKSLSKEVRLRETHRAGSWRCHGLTGFQPLPCACCLRCSDWRGLASALSPPVFPFFKGVPTPSLNPPNNLIVHQGLGFQSTYLCIGIDILFGGLAIGQRTAHRGIPVGIGWRAMLSAVLACTYMATYLYIYIHIYSSTHPTYFTQI